MSNVMDVGIRADLHGTIFCACDKLTTDLRYDCRSVLKYVLKCYDIFSYVRDNRKRVVGLS